MCIYIYIYIYFVSPSCSSVSLCCLVVLCFSPNTDAQTAKQVTVPPRLRSPQQPIVFNMWYVQVGVSTLFSTAASAETLSGTTLGVSFC